MIYDILSTTPIYDTVEMKCRLADLTNLHRPTIRRYCTFYPKLACFVLYRKIINIFLKNNICIIMIIVNCPRKSTTLFGFLEDAYVFCFLFFFCFVLFFFQEGIDYFYFGIECKTCCLFVKGAVPP